MKIYRQPFLVIWIMIWCMTGIQSCSYNHFKGFEKVSRENILIPATFDTSFRKATYITDFIIAGNQLSGITIIKNMPNTNTFHIVFMSQIGLKYFDISIASEKNKDWFAVNYLMKSLDRDFIVEALKKDFALLLTSNDHKYLEFFQDPLAGRQEIISRNGKEVVSYLIEEDNLSTISSMKGKSTVTSIRITEYSEGYPKVIIINDKKARLAMSLSEF